MFEENPQNINDISSPGTTAAAPFSRPIIVTDHPAQADPMVADHPADLSTPPAPASSFADQAAIEAAQTPDHFHSLQHDAAFAYDVKRHRYSAVGVFATIFFMAAAAFLGYYLTKVYLIK
jgi:hypothetical protein